MLLDGRNSRAGVRAPQPHERDWPPALSVANLETSGGIRAGCSAVGRIEWWFEVVYVSLAALCMGVLVARVA